MTTETRQPMTTADWEQMEKPEQEALFALGAGVAFARLFGLRFRLQEEAMIAEGAETPEPPDDGVRSS